MTDPREPFDTDDDVAAIDLDDAATVDGSVDVETGVRETGAAEGSLDTVDLTADNPMGDAPAAGRGNGSRGSVDDALVADPPLLPVARERATEVLPRIVQRSWKRLDRAMKTAERTPHGAEQDELLHEARKDAKRARYVAEGVVPVFGEPARTYAKAVAQLQEVLGEHQDGVVTRDALREIGDQAHEAGENAFTYGRLHGTEQARAEAAAARWPDVRAEVSVRRLRRWFEG